MGQVTRNALSTRQYELARVAARRGQFYALTLQESLEWKFYQAIALNQLGQVASAEKLMRHAAPLDHPGYAPAHLALAQALLTATNLTPEKLHLVEQHLNNALKLDPNSIAVNEMLGRYYINTHQSAKARQHLEKIFSQKPEVALLLAVNENADYDSAKTIFWARQATTAFEKNLRAAVPHDSPTDRLGLDAALLLQKNYLGAAHVLEAGLGSEKSPAYYVALAEVCDKWGAQLTQNTSNSADAVELWLAIIFLSHGPEPIGSKAQAHIQKQLHGPPAIAAWWHLLLATYARWQNHPDEVRAHLQTAYQLDPQNPAIANDYAYYLATDQLPDLPQALSIIQPVAKKFPQNPNYRDTRGKILLLMNRPIEAATDLEFAAAQPNCGVTTIEALAKAYQTAKSGQPTPEQLKLWPRLIDLAHSHIPLAIAMQALIKQQSEEAAPGVAAWWHYFLAADARKIGQVTAIRTHLQTACRMVPENPQFASALALDMAFNQPEDLKQALAIIQPLVTKFPNLTDYRGIRGRILLRLGRIQPAVEDLTWVANHSSEPDNEVLQALAEANNLLRPPASKPVHKLVYPAMRITNAPVKKMLVE